MSAVGRPEFNPEEWFGLARQVSERVGGIILFWQAIELQINETIMAIRTRRWTRLQEPYSYDMARRFDDRLAEWLDLTLPPLNRAEERASLEKQLLALKIFRNLVADGIVGMSISDSGALVIATEQRHQRTRQSDKPGDDDDNSGATIIQYSAYDQQSFIDMELKMLQIIALVREVCVSRLGTPET